MSVSVDADIYGRIESERGFIKRSTFVNEILRQHYAEAIERCCEC